MREVRLSGWSKKNWVISFLENDLELEIRGGNVDVRDVRRSH
jgi:hypothetical protein